MRDIKRHGKTAKILYQAKTEGSEELVDRQPGDDPFTVVLGAGNVPYAIEEALFLMEIGEIRTVDVPPELGFGIYDLEACQWYPRMMFKNGYELNLGSIVPWTNPEDRKTLPGRVIETTQDTVRIDFNHPLAGKTVIYQLELVSLE